MTSRFWKITAVLATLALIAGVASYAAFAVNTSVDLNGGDAVAVNCNGGGRLAQLRITRTQIRDVCMPGPTTTTAPPTTTQPPGTTTTTQPSGTTTTTTTTMPPGGGGGGGGVNCTSDPQGSLGPFSYNGITNSNGFNTYVANNMWGAQSGTVQTVCANNPGSWTLAAKTTQDQGGAVQTYPNVQQLTNNWTGSNFGPCGNCTDVPLASLHTISSSFNITNPPTNQGAWWAAYDVWTSSGELMLVTTGSDFRLANNGSTITNPDVVIGGLHFTDQHFGSLDQLVLHGNPTSGTIDFRAVFDYWIQTGHLAANATMGQFDYGWEICDTGGQALNFQVNGYSLTMSP